MTPPPTPPRRPPLERTESLTSGCHRPLLAQGNFLSSLGTMSFSLGCQQFNNDFVPKRLCNWEVPAMREKEPVVRPPGHRTQIIVDDDGHLLPGTPKRMTSFTTGYENTCAPSLQAPPSASPPHARAPSPTHALPPRPSQLAKALARLAGRALHRRRHDGLQGDPDGLLARLHRLPPQQPGLARVQLPLNVSRREREARARGGARAESARRWVPGTHPRPLPELRPDARPPPSHPTNPPFYRRILDLQCVRV